VSWPLVSIAEFCDARLGKMLDKKRNSGANPRPYLRNVNVRWGTFDLSDLLEMDFDDSERQVFALRQGDLLVCEGGEVGRCAIWRGELAECYFQKALHRLRPDPNRCLPEYLQAQFFFLASTGRLLEHTSTSTIAHLTGVKLAQLKIPLPPLSEQRRIVDILDRAASIQKLRRQAEAKAREIIPALFVDMFGDPDANPHNLPMQPLGAVIERIEAGRNLSAGTGLNDFKILKVSAVTSGQYRELERKPAPDDYTPPVEHIVKKDDFLFSRANTVELVGATTIVDDTDGRTLLPDKLWRITWRRGIAAEYMSALLQNQFVRATLGRLSSGTSASMRNISQSKLLAMKLPIAAQNEQAAFAEAAKCVNGVVRLSKQASGLSQSAAEALLGRELGSIESASHV